MDREAEISNATRPLVSLMSTPDSEYFVPSKKELTSAGSFIFTDTFAFPLPMTKASITTSS